MCQALFEELTHTVLILFKPYSNHRGEVLFFPHFIGEELNGLSGKW